MDNKYSTRSNFLESGTVDNFIKMRLDKKAVIQMKSRKREQNQRKIKLGIYMKRIKQTLVLRRKKLLYDIKNLVELLLMQKIRRTVGNLVDSRKNRETCIIR